MWKPKTFWNLLKQHKDLKPKITGFSGQCAQLAFCAQEYLYPDAEVVGAFNLELFQQGYPYGHVFLYKDGVYFDAIEASDRIGPFLPLIRLNYKDGRINPQMSRPNRLVKQKGDSLIILRHMKRSDIPLLANQYPWVCRIFKKL